MDQYPRRITAPLITKPVGLGDAVEAVTKAVGIRPCGSCQKRKEALNRALRFVPSLKLPEGYKLVLQGQRDRDTQILLARSGDTWATYTRSVSNASMSNVVHENGVHDNAVHDDLAQWEVFPTEHQARLDFKRRIGSAVGEMRK